jgi:hypothetical protein
MCRILADVTWRKKCEKGKRKPRQNVEERRKKIDEEKTEVNG